MIRDMCDQFLDTEVMPILDRIDKTGTRADAIVSGKSR